MSSVVVWMTYERSASSSMASAYSFSSLLTREIGNVYTPDGSGRNSDAGSACQTDGVEFHP